MRLFSHSSMSVDAVRLRLPLDDCGSKGQGIPPRLVVGMSSGGREVGCIKLGLYHHQLP